MPGRFFLYLSLGVELSGLAHFLVKRRAMLREFLLFLKAERVWWMAPILLVLLLLAALMFMSQSAILAPFIYPIF